MEVHFAVHVSIIKGLGPETAIKIIEVGFDDIESDVTDAELKEMARMEVDTILRRSEDYPLYGKNWTVVDIERT